MPVEGGAVDVHSHYVCSPHLEALRLGTRPEDDGFALPPFTVEKTLEVMDEHGIEASVLSPISPPPVFPSTQDAVRVSAEINDGLAEIIRAHPHRFGAVGFLPMPDVDATLQAIGYILDDLGLDGVHLFSSYDGKYLGHPDFTPVLAELDRREVTVDTHPTTPADSATVSMGWPGPALEFPFDTTRTACDLVFSGAMDRFENLTLILPHGGGALMQMLERTLRAVEIWPNHPVVKHQFPNMPTDVEHADQLFKRFYLDVTWNTHAPILGALAQIWGADHLLFGTDRPFPVPVAQDLAKLDTNPDIDETAKELIRRGNTLRLFPTLAKRLG